MSGPKVETLGQNSPGQEPEVVGLNVIGAPREVLSPNRYGSKPKTTAPPRAWLPGDAGRHGKPIEYDGQQFFAREVEKSALNQFAREERRIQRGQANLAQQMQIELRTIARDAEAEKKAAIERGEDEPFISLELPPERADFYEAESERLSDEMNAAHNALLSAGIVGWSLPHEFEIELLLQFSKVDKVFLCQSIAERSIAGYQAAKN